MTFTLNREAFVQVSWAYYPHLEVRLDGDIITPSETALGMIGFAAGEGTHDLTITARLSPLRRGLNLLAGAVLVGTGIWAGIDERRRRRRRNRNHSW